MRDVTIHGESIRLGQILKLAGVVASGAEAKALIAGSRVRVNGTIETRRGRRLGSADVVQACGEELRVGAAEVSRGGLPR